MPEPIRWGILGSGRVATGFAAGLRAVPDARLVGVASRSRTNAERFAAGDASIRVHDDYESLVDDPDIDVVYVATPNHRHADDVMTCLSHGKAVLCEKPFTQSLSQAQVVVEEARRKNVFCMEAMWMRFVPAVAELRSLVSAGRIGEVQSVVCDFSTAVSIDPADRLFDPAQGGGAALDLGVYGFSFVHMLLGAADEVTGRARIGSTDVDETMAAISTHANGGLGVVTASLSGSGANHAVITGTEGAIRVAGPLCSPESMEISRHRFEAPQAGVAEAPLVPANTQSRVAKLRQQPAVRGVLQRAKPIVARIRNDVDVVRLPVEQPGYQYEIEEVHRCLRAGETESSVISLSDTLDVMSMVDAAMRGFTSGRAT